MEALSNAGGLWSFIAAGALALIWFVRLEAKVLNTDKDVAELKIDHKSMNSQFSEIKTSLAKIEGYLYGRTDGPKHGG
jgi:hypothetical protein